MHRPQPSSKSGRPKDPQSVRHGSDRLAKTLGRIALLLWVASCLLPAGRTGGRLVFGWEMAMHAFNPMLIFFEPFGFLAAWTNIVFLAQAGRIQMRRQASTVALAISCLINLLALAQPASAPDPLIDWAGPTALTPFLWLASFLVLLSAALSQGRPAPEPAASEPLKAGAPTDRHPPPDIERDEPSS